MKVNISISAELLQRIDAEAEALGTSRSGLIQEASMRYLTQVERDREAEARRLKTKAAAKRMKDAGRHLGIAAGSDVVELLREARAEEERRDGR